MATAVSVWGIDVGRCALKAIKLRPAGDNQVQIVDLEYFEHPSVIGDGEGRQFQQIAEALEKFLANHDITKDKIVVGVPGQHTLARFSKLPPVEPKKIPDIVRYEADQQIPFDLDDVIWDYQTFQEEDAPDVEVGIFAIKRELIRDYLLPFEQSGIEPVAVQSSPLAVYNAMKFEGRLDSGASVLLDVGAENTNLIVATDHGLWTRTIPLGGNKFTDALVKSFKLNFAKAENLKRTAASSKYARQVFQAMRPVFAEFVQELSRSLGFYRSTHREAELKRVIGLGNAFKLPGLQKYLQQNLQLPVDKPESFRNVDSTEVNNHEAFKEQLPSFVVSFGLALQGLEATKAMPKAAAITSNLLPPEIVKHVIWRKKRPFLAASAACLMLASGIVWFRRQTDLGAMAANAGKPVAKVSYVRATDLLNRGVSGLPPREEGATWLAVAKAFQAEMGKYKNSGQIEVDRSNEILQLQRNKAVWPAILSVIHRALPQPQGALAGVDDPEKIYALVSSDKTGTLARGKRTEIYIERMTTEYKDDVTKTDLWDVVSREPKVVVEEPEVKKGFVVTLECRTPNQDKYRFVADTFKTALMSFGAKPDMGFFINRVVIAGGRDFSEKKGKGTRPPPPPSGRGRGRNKKAPPPRKKLTTVKRYDPVTDEPMDSDWVFEIRFDVILADLPKKEEAKSDQGV